MSSNQGKVSFSFSKITKKPSLQVQPKETIKKVDKIEYIGSIENNSVKLLNAQEDEEKKPLVIPLQHPNLLVQSIIDTVKSRSGVSDLTNDDDNGIKVEENDSSIKRNENETLDEMAARELLEDASKRDQKKPESNITVPLANQNYDKQESSLEDYENIPVGDFGLAMLRGMGWDPKKGIGKNGKIVKVEGPNVRPKGLGLGADKAISAQAPLGKNVSEKEVLSKGSKVRVTVGPYKNLYGTVEGFDDDTGRINVYMTISNDRVSMNEYFVQLVTPDEFSKYSKVLNINAYNNYKDKCGDFSTMKEEAKRSESPENNRNPKQLQRSSTSVKSIKNYSSEDEISYKQTAKDSKSYKDRSKRHDSHSDFRDHQNSSKSSFSKDVKYSSKYESSKDHRSKSKYESKHSKKYSSNSESSDEDTTKKKRCKDSRRPVERRRSSSSSDDYSRRKKNKKDKKKKRRSRSRSRR